MGHADPPAARQPKGELHAAPVVEDGAVFGFGCSKIRTHMRKHAVDRYGDVMHQRRQKAAAQRPRAGFAELATGRLAELGGVLRLEVGAQRGGNVVRFDHRHVRDERVLIRIVHLDSNT